MMYMRKVNCNGRTPCEQFISTVMFDRKDRSGHFVICYITSTSVCA